MRFATSSYTQLLNNRCTLYCSNTLILLITFVNCLLLAEKARSQTVYSVPVSTINNGLLTMACNHVLWSILSPQWDRIHF